MVTNFSFDNLRARRPAMELLASKLNHFKD